MCKQTRQDNVALGQKRPGLEGKGSLKGYNMRTICRTAWATPNVDRVVFPIPRSWKTEGADRNLGYTMSTCRNLTQTAQIWRKTGKWQHCRLPQPHMQLKKSCKYAAHEEFPHLRKTESNWPSNEWDEIKAALFTSLPITICEQVFKQKRHIAYSKSAQAERMQGKQQNKYTSKHIWQPPGTHTPELPRPFRIRAGKKDLHLNTRHIPNICVHLLL